MPGLTWSPKLVARAYDTNKNGVMDELKMAPELAAQLDTSKDGKVSADELATAIDKDTVVIRGDMVMAWSKKVEASPLDAKLDAANRAIVGAEKDVDALTALKGTLPKVVEYTKGRFEVAAAYINAMYRASYNRPNAREKQAISDLQGLQTRANARLRQLYAVDMDAAPKALAQKAREVYELGVATTRGDEAPTASQAGRADAELDRLTTDVAAISAKAKADQAVITGPGV